MLSDILRDLRTAIDSNDAKEQEKIFRNLERLGVDRISAVNMTKALTQYEKEQKVS